MIVHRGPTSILAPNPGESYDCKYIFDCSLKGLTKILTSYFLVSSSHQQPIFVTQPLRNNSGVRSPIGLYPNSGLGSLDGLDSVQIYQTCELTECKLDFFELYKIFYFDFNESLLLI